ncbi:MAG: c-type cytochrome [Polynucleobacter sp.]
MKIQFTRCLIVALAFSTSVFAKEKNASGVYIYKEVCAACHNSGVANAPKIGDINAWKKLISEGQIIITAHGYVGVRAMPPRGGKEELSVEQFAEALTYMVNKSGGDWLSPNKSMLEEISREINKRQKTQ